MIVTFIRPFILIFALLLSLSANAHQLSTGYITAEMDNNGRLQGNWQLNLLDLQLALELDADFNGQLTWAEVLERNSDIASYLQSKLSIERSGRPCTLLIKPALSLQDHANEAYLVSDFSAQCRDEGELNLSYSAIFDFDAQHKVIVNIQHHKAFHSHVLDKDKRQLNINLLKADWQATFVEYLQQGVYHIWIGLDHILFLLALLLPAVLWRNRKTQTWQPQASKKAVFKHTLYLISAFTLAHSITLTGTALGWISPSSRWVEVGIAASVLLTACNNIWPLVYRLGWLTFAFGLLHGMGFASVLAELGLPSEQQLLAVLAFNLGVELGQVTILALILPLLLLLRGKRIYSRILMPLGSLVIAGMSVMWLIERV